MSAHKQYLGDSVYVDYDGYMIVLTTENGWEATNTIYLEPQVLTALNQYMLKLKAEVNDVRKMS